MPTLLDLDRLWDSGATRPWDDGATHLWDTADRLWDNTSGRLWDNDTARGWPRYDVPAAIPADGSVDVTADLQAWLNSLPDGATARLAAGGLYKTEGTLLLKGRVNFTLDGNGATIQAFTDGTGTTPPDSVFQGSWPRCRSRIIVYGGSGVTVRGVTLRGGHPNAGAISGAYVAALEAQMGVWFKDHTGGTFSGSQVYDVYGDMAYVQNSTGITVAGIYGRRTGRHAVAVSAGSDVDITGNDVADTGRAIFDLEGNTDADVIDGINIVGNTTGAARLLWLTNGGQSWHISNVTVADNVMTALTGVPVISVINTETDGRRGPYTITGNTFLVAGSPAVAFRFDKVDGVTFANNAATFPPEREMTAIRLTDAEAVVYGNSFTGQAVDVQTVIS